MAEVEQAIFTNMCMIKIFELDIMSEFYYHKVDGEWQFELY